MTLINCSIRGDFEAVKLLLENGADINNPDRYGRTALLWASRHGHLEVVKLLLENGADINSQTGWEVTPSDVASDFSHFEVVKLLERGEDMEEWRPWTHCKLSSKYRGAMSTLLLLAKS